MTISIFSGVCYGAALLHKRSGTYHDGMIIADKDNYVYARVGAQIYRLYHNGYTSNKDVTWSYLTSAFQADKLGRLKLPAAQGPMTP